MFHTFRGLWTGCATTVKHACCHFIYRLTLIPPNRDARIQRVSFLPEPEFAALSISTELRHLAHLQCPTSDDVRAENFFLEEFSAKRTCHWNAFHDPRIQQCVQVKSSPAVYCPCEVQVVSRQSQLEPRSPSGLHAASSDKPSCLCASYDKALLESERKRRCTRGSISTSTSFGDLAYK
jgi:hypothetical protein